jgi:hypothetical protein
MLRENDDRINRERPFPARNSKRFAQNGDVVDKNG